MLLYNRAIAHYAAKQYAQSADDNSRVLELKPGHSEALNNRGMARRALGDADGALADFSAAVGADKAAGATKLLSRVQSAACGRACRVSAEPRSRRKTTQSKRACAGAPGGAGSAGSPDAAPAANSADAAPAANNGAGGTASSMLCAVRWCSRATRRRLKLTPCAALRHAARASGRRRAV